MTCDCGVLHGNCLNLATCNTPVPSPVFPFRLCPSLHRQSPNHASCIIAGAWMSSLWLPCLDLTAVDGLVQAKTAQRNADAKADLAFARERLCKLNNARRQVIELDAAIKKLRSEASTRALLCFHPSVSPCFSISSCFSFPPSPLLSSSPCLACRQLTSCPGSFS